MSVSKKFLQHFLLAVCLLPCLAFPAVQPRKDNPIIQNSFFAETPSEQLGWVEDKNSPCGGYYLEQPFIYPLDPQKENTIETIGNQGIFSFRGTSIIKGKVTINRLGQQITTNQAIFYRDPKTGKLHAIDLLGDVHLREPNTLIIAKKGHYNFKTKTKAFTHIIYRTVLNKKMGKIPAKNLEKERKITGLTAFGRSYQFYQTELNIFELSKASFSTCPPKNPAWQIKASHIVLNKNTGRGYATHARLLVKGLPVLYMPYINFSIDNQRKSGFLWPTIGGSSKWGPYLLTPFYWNIAENYDMTLTPGLLTKRNIQLSDRFRYLTETSSGDLNFSILPNDQLFSDFKKAAPGKVAAGDYGTPTDPVISSELNRLTSTSTTRKGLFWRDDSQFNDHWSSHVDFNYAGDDYYMRDFGNLNQITQNQLLQEGDLYYKGPNWNFTGRIQSYQTLHPVDQAAVLNQYRRFPQLILNGDYPDQPLGLEYFINNEITHFEILKTPGTTNILPVGNRMHTQPGIALPFNWPYFYINPRIQLALTQYQLDQTSDTGTPNSKRRTVPIFDVASGVTLSRDAMLFNHAFQQTLEPQVYYVYIPYRNQTNIPLFDTTLNTLTYDQIFNYNRFSGLDRIGDANQVGWGIATRFIDQESGLEKVRLGIGEIIYFANRRVTLCNSQSTCFDTPDNFNNKQSLSPLSSILDYHINPQWKLSVDAIFDPVRKQMDNSTLGIHYEPDQDHIINMGYSFAHSSNPYSGISLNNSPENNLQITDFSFAWPLAYNVSTVGRVSKDWRENRLQNLLYGLQYDTCCWAIQFVGGRALTNIVNNAPQYNNEFYIQFALKGIGDVGSGNPSGLLSTISGYHSQLGREF